MLIARLVGLSLLIPAVAAAINAQAQERIGQATAFGNTTDPAEAASVGFHARQVGVTRPAERGRAVKVDNLSNRQISCRMTIEYNPSGRMGGEIYRTIKQHQIAPGAFALEEFWGGDIVTFNVTCR